MIVGSSTGRDGIHGATFASEEISEKSEAKRPSVQVGDPFTEKLLLEAIARGDPVRLCRGDPGHGRRRHHLLHLGDERERGERHARSIWTWFRPAKTGMSAYELLALGVAGTNAGRRAEGA